MTIDKFNFAGKKAIVRVDFNVPLDENGKISLSVYWNYDFFITDIRDVYKRQV